MLTSACSAHFSTTTRALPRSERPLIQYGATGGRSNRHCAMKDVGPLAVTGRDRPERLEPVGEACTWGQRNEGLGSWFLVLGSGFWSDAVYAVEQFLGLDGAAVIRTEQGQAGIVGSRGTGAGLGGAAQSQQGGRQSQLDGAGLGAA